jgi:hypothetical protein
MNTENFDLPPISSNNYVGAYLGTGIQLYNLLEWALKQTGKAKITVMTFSISEEFIRKIWQLKKADLIDDISVLIDFKTIQKTRKLERFAGNVFTQMYYAKTHAKLILIRNEKWNVSIVSSQNFTKGNREESGVIMTESNAFNKYKTEIERITSQAIKYDCSQNEKIAIQAKIKTPHNQKQHISFSNSLVQKCQRGYTYIALVNNINMDLEHLKTNPKNIEYFVFPVIRFIKDNNITQILVAPKGSRYNKNGFHFATDLLLFAQKFIEFEIIDAFENRNNHIYLRPDITFSPDAWLFDDIITYGRTILKMKTLSNLTNIFILIEN